jgi:4-hydroxybenzoate polyprenyltransferase
MSYVLKSLIAFFLFSLCAGALYTFNDIIDAENDRGHPVKKNRPIASGKITVRTAWVVFLFTSVFSLVMSFLFHPPFGIVIVSYCILQILYTFFLKKIVIVDVFAISFGFILRVVAGALAIDVVISNWIVICTMLLALFLALSKRRHELILLETNADDHRMILKEYSPYLLDQMIGIVTSATLVAYTIFALSEETTAKFGNMVLTVPFVLYGIFRYLYLIHIKDKGGQPEEILLTDIPLQVDIILYGLVALVVIYL